MTSRAPLFVAGRPWGWIRAAVYGAAIFIVVVAAGIAGHAAALLIGSVAGVAFGLIDHRFGARDRGMIDWMLAMEGDADAASGQARSPAPRE